MNLIINKEEWPLAKVFAIARGAKTKATVIRVAVQNNSYEGHGECVPYARYGESLESVEEQIESVRVQLSQGMTRQELQSALPAGAARNAVDCALLDLEAKTKGKSAYAIMGLKKPERVTTAYTLSLDTAENMALAAKEASHRPLLKLKLGQPGDPERLKTIRAAVPNIRLIIDANEGWNENNIEENLQACLETSVELIEQPLPAQQDEILKSIKSPIPICADESAHDSRTLEKLIGKYTAINIKLDKTGGITEAIKTAQLAKNMGLAIMVGCMVGTSLAMAPATLITNDAQFVDLDAPLLLAEDRKNGLRYDGSTLYPPEPALWG